MWHLYCCCCSWTSSLDSLSLTSIMLASSAAVTDALSSNTTYATAGARSLSTCGMEKMSDTTQSECEMSHVAYVLAYALLLLHVSRMELGPMVAVRDWAGQQYWAAVLGVYRAAVLRGLACSAVLGCCRGLASMCAALCRELCNYCILYCGVYWSVSS